MSPNGSLNGLTTLLSVVVASIITILFGLIIGAYRYIFLKTKELWIEVRKAVSSSEDIKREQEKARQDLKLVFSLLDAFKETLVRIKAELEVELARLRHKIKELESKTKGGE
jgi:uncharacterized protein HemX